MGSPSKDLGTCRYSVSTIGACPRQYQNMLGAIGEPWKNGAPHDLAEEAHSQSTINLQQFLTEAGADTRREDRKSGDLYHDEVENNCFDFAIYS